MSQSQSDKSCLMCGTKARLVRRMSENIIKLIKKLTKYKNVTSENSICEICLDVLKARFTHLRQKLTQSSTDSSKELSPQRVASRKRPRAKVFDSNNFLQSQSNTTSSQTSSQPLPKRHSAGAVNTSDHSTTGSSSDDLAVASIAPRQRNVRINNDLIGYRRTTGG